MNGPVAELSVDPLEVLRQRRSAKWQTYPADVLPLTVAEMDFALAAPIAEALREAVERSDVGYAMAVPDLGRAVAGFAGRRWDWDLDPASVTAVTDVGVGVVELLRVLAINEGKLLTHRALLKEVWGPGYGSESNLLHVNISQLRRKIEPDRARPRYLLTEPGAGYRLVAPA